MGAQYNNILVEVCDGVAVLTVNRPKVLNALDVDTTVEIGAAIDALGADDAVGAIVVTGAGDKAFVAGADINVLIDHGPEEGRRAALLGQRAFDRIEKLQKPVIAAINGYALGGGCELALACHLRIASDRARIGLPEINLGVIPGHGGTQRLPRLVGKGVALELICSGRHVEADEAKRIGLVNDVVLHDELEERVRTLASSLAQKAPIAMRYAIAAVGEGLECGHDEGMAIESTYFGLCCATEDKVEGMQAFLDKRKPEWKGS